MVKCEDLSTLLRNQIAAGKFGPGKRMPTRREMCDRYRASLVTVQRALEALESEGFVYADGRNGTFVSALPPHLCQYAIIFQYFPSQEDRWVRYWTALSNEAARLQKNSSRRFILFHGLDKGAQSEEYPRLEAAVRRHSLAGLIFPTSAYRLAGTPVLDLPNLPRVAVHDRKEFGIPVVTLDGQALVRRALDHFAAKGRRRVAAIMAPGHAPQLVNFFQQEAARRGMIHKPYWMQSVAQYAAEWARNTVHLLLQGNPNERPNALLIADDNLVEYATAGIVAAGLRAPDDVEVVGHCNFPWPTPSVLPIRRLGYDVRELLALCLDALDKQRAGARVPDSIPVLPRFEDELPRARNGGSSGVLVSVRDARDLLTR
ncbi:MAG TPA: GntR family transcriptional regulator [Planctomycetota bacterium]|jgi:DNA-binding LacI/PurR family transcriptional regulator